MTESTANYFSLVKQSLEYALNIRYFPSQECEKMSRPQVEVKESPELILKPIRIARKEDDYVEIEPTINSVRINILWKKHNELEKLLTNMYTSYLMKRAEKLEILRKVPVEGYDLSFLITDRHFEVYDKDLIIELILQIMSDFEKELTEMKLNVSSQLRFSTELFVKQFN